MNLGEFIKTKRTALGISTRELSKIVGVSTSAVSKWETGEIKNIKQDKIQPLAQALRVNASELLGYISDDTVNTLAVKKVPVYDYDNVLVTNICTENDNIFMGIRCENNDLVLVEKATDIKDFKEKDLIVVEVEDKFELTVALVVNESSVLSIVNKKPKTLFPEDIIGRVCEHREYR